jgi:hypothetical protein
VQLFACPQSTANGGPSNMVQGTRAHTEHTGWRHQHQRQNTHTLTAPTTRRTNAHQVQSYTLCQTNCSSARDGRRASYRQYMKTVGKPRHPGSAGRRPVVGPKVGERHTTLNTKCPALKQRAGSHRRHHSIHHPSSNWNVALLAAHSNTRGRVGEPMGCKWGGGSHPQP